MAPTKTATKRGNGYRILVSNGYDVNGKKIQETTICVPDPNMTERQQAKALERFAFEFEEKVKNGKYLSGEKMTFKELHYYLVKEYAVNHLGETTLEDYILYRRT